MPRTKQVATGVPTIDVELVVIQTGTEDNGLEIAIETSDRVAVEPQTETTDAIKLMKLGRLLAQKMAQTVITGHQITLRDNVFTPLLAKVFQGGTLGEPDEYGFQAYTPPLAGEKAEGEIFNLVLYSAVYDEAGIIKCYEKTTYPNCKGTPFSMTSEDNVFRIPEYTINSAPKKGQPPFKIEYVDALPTFDSRMADMSDVTLPIA